MCIYPFGITKWVTGSCFLPRTARVIGLLRASEGCHGDCRGDRHFWLRAVLRGHPSGMVPQREETGAQWQGQRQTGGGLACTSFSLSSFIFTCMLLVLSYCPLSPFPFSSHSSVISVDVVKQVPLYFVGFNPMIFLLKWLKFLSTIKF